MLAQRWTGRCLLKGMRLAWGTWIRALMLREGLRKDMMAKGVAHMGREAKAFGSTVTAVAAAILVSAALVVFCAVPCFASTEEVSAQYPLDLSVDVAKDGEKVVSAVVPSSVSIVVKTSVVDGRIMGVATNTASIENSRRSYAPIAISVQGVVDEPVADNKLLNFVDMTLSGQYTVALQEGVDQGLALFDSIAPGTTEQMQASLTQKDPDELIPAGAYVVRSTLLVTPVEQNGGKTSL